MYFDKKINLIKNNKKNILIIFLIYFFARYYGCFEKGFWGDEILTFWWTNPDQGFFDLNERLLKSVPVRDYVPVYYYYLVSLFHNYFGYNVIVTKSFSFLFSLFAFYFLYRLSKLFLNENFALLFLTLLALSNFLIWISHDARVASFLFFSQVINIYFFCFYFIFKEKNNKFDLILLLFVNTFILSIHPMNIILIISQFVFVFLTRFIGREKISYSTLFVILLSVLFTVILNYNYYYQSFSQSAGISNSPLTWTSLINLNFRTYFASIFFGFLNLVIFLIAIFKFRKIMLKKNFLSFFLIIFLLTYFFIISVSLLKANVNAPRYYPYIVPIVLAINIYFLQSIRNVKVLRFLVYVFLFFSILSFFIKFNDPIVKSPDAKSYLKVINSKQNIPIVIVDGGNSLLSHYLNIGFRSKYSNQNIFIIKNKKDLNKMRLLNYWLVCDSAHNSIKDCQINNEGKYFFIKGFHVTLYN